VGETDRERSTRQEECRITNKNFRDMSKEFKVVIAQDENDTVTISVSSTGWNDYELAGIQAKLPKIVEDALQEQHAVVEEEKRKCYCGHTTTCECEPMRDSSDEE